MIAQHWLPLFCHLLHLSGLTVEVVRPFLGVAEFFMGKQRKVER